MVDKKTLTREELLDKASNDSTKQLINTLFDKGYRPIPITPKRRYFNENDPIIMLPYEDALKVNMLSAAFTAGSAIIENMSLISDDFDGNDAKITQKDMSKITYSPTLQYDNPAYHLYFHHDEFIHTTALPTIPLTPIGQNWDDSNKLHKEETRHKAASLDCQYIRMDDMRAVNYAPWVEPQSRRSVPLTFGMIKNFPGHKPILKSFVETHKDEGVMRDIIREFPTIQDGNSSPWLAGISLSTAVNCHTKQELLEKTFNCKIPPAANKCSLIAGIAAASVSPRLPPTAKARLWQNAVEATREARPIQETIHNILETDTVNADDSHYNPNNFNLKLAPSINDALAYTQYCETRWVENEFAAHIQPYPNVKARQSWRDAIKLTGLGYAFAYPNLFSEDKAYVYGNGDIDYKLRSSLRDMDEMSRQINPYKKLPEQINSIRRLNEIHDELATRQREIERRKELAKLEEQTLDVSNSRFAVVDELLAEDGWERITSAKDMLEEGERQHNCVFSYRNDMLKEKAAFYTGVFDDKRHTLQIFGEANTGDPQFENTTQFHKGQLYSKYNDSPNNAAVNSVNRSIRLANMSDQLREKALNAEQKAEAGGILRKLGGGCHRDPCRSGFDPGALFL